MSIETGIYAYLSNNPTLTNVIGFVPDSNPLIAQLFPDVAPSNARLPYIVYFVVSGRSTEAFDGDVGLNKDRIEFDIYADTSDSRLLLFKALKGLLSGAGGILMGDTWVQNVTFDEHRDSWIKPEDAQEQGIFRREVDFLFTYNEVPPLLV
jgi:hypothetical protein